MRAKKAQQKSEENYIKILKELPDIVYVINQDGSFVFLNNSIRVLGYEPEELIGKHFSKIVHPDDAKYFSRSSILPKYKGKVTGDENVPKLFDERRTGKRKTKDLEIRLLSKNRTKKERDLQERVGTVIILGDVSSSGYYDSDAQNMNKKFRGTLGIIRDITKHKRIEEALRKSEERFRQFFENEPAYCYMISPNGTILDVNTNAVKTLGYKKKELIGKPLKTIYAPESHQKMKQLFEKWRKTGILKDEEMVIITKSGERCTVLLSTNAIRNKDGKISHSISVQKDITERKRITEALRESEERYRSLIENAPDTIAVHREGKIIYINPAGAKLLGAANPEELIGKPIMNFLHPDYRKIVKKRIRKIKEKGFQAPILKEKFIRADGTDVDVEVVAIPFLYHGKKAVQTVVRDITERKKTEEELKQQQEMLLASQKELKIFSRRILAIKEEEKKKLSTNLHDEVGALTVALSSNMSKIEQQIKDKKLTNALETIALNKLILKKATTRLRKLAVDLRPPDLEIIGLPDALREYFSNVTDQTDIRIDFSVDIDYKKLSENASIILYRIVQEALNNIIKHAEAKNVKVRLHSRKKGITLRVCDDGKGFDVEKNIQETKIRIGIRGMREMAESLDGTFVIKSIPGKGTDVRVMLPVKMKDKK